MEREKQKRDERERFLLERELNRKKQLMTENSQLNDPAASRFDSEESEGDDLENDRDEGCCSISKLEPIRISNEDLVSWLLLFFCCQFLQLFVHFVQRF